MHTDPGFPLTVGEGCTIGHRALLHGCTVGDNSLIGMGAIILNGARIGANSLVGAGALVTEGKVFPERSLIVGAAGQGDPQAGRRGGRAAAGNRPSTMSRTAAASSPASSRCGRVRATAIPGKCAASGP